MTQDEYQLYTFFKPPEKVEEKLVYIGSGEDFEMELAQQHAPVREAQDVLHS